MNRIGRPPSYPESRVWNLFEYDEAVPLETQPGEEPAA